MRRPRTRSQTKEEGSLLSELGTDELSLVVDQLDEDDAFAFASTCRAFRAATCLAGSAAARFGERGIRTSVAGSWASVARLRWAVGLGYEMNSDHLAHAASMGHLEVLQWARANGCEWDAGTCSSQCGLRRPDLSPIVGICKVSRWIRRRPLRRPRPHHASTSSGSAIGSASRAPLAVPPWPSGCARCCPSRRRASAATAAGLHGWTGIPSQPASIHSAAGG